MPGVCARLGLTNGDSSEAFNSKYKYAMNRLVSVPAEDVLPMAKLLLQDVTRYSLSEQVSKIEDYGQPAVTEITRRRLMSVFKTRPLATEMEEVELIQRTWPLDEIPSPYGNSKGILDDIYLRGDKSYVGNWVMTV